MEQKLKVAIADSHAIVREGIANRLIADCGVDIVAMVSDGYTTIKVCRNTSPDYLLMDLGLTRPSGAETFAKLRERQPEMKIIVMSSEPSSHEAYLMMAKGAVGFISKHVDSRHFASVLQSASMGFTSFPSEFVESFVRLRSSVSRSGNIYGLSPREYQVLEAAASGARTQEIADQLNISIRTVETHRNSIYKKTQSRNVNDLAKIILR